MKTGIKRNILQVKYVLKFFNKYLNSLSSLKNAWIFKYKWICKRFDVKKKPEITPNKSKEKDESDMTSWEALFLFIYLLCYNFSVLMPRLMDRTPLNMLVNTDNNQ